MPDPQHVTLTSSLGNVIISRSNVTLTCSVQMSSSVMDDEVSLLMVEAQLIKPSGIILNLSHPERVGTTYNFTTRVISLSDDDVGIYTCIARVRSGPLSTYLTGTGELSGKTELRIGEMHCDRNFFKNNNYNSFARNSLYNW